MPRIDYVPDLESGNNATRPRLSDLLSHEIPKESHSLACYLHNCMLVLECYLKSDDPTLNEKNVDLKKKLVGLKKKIEAYWVMKRNVLINDIKQLIWLVICRLRLLLYKKIGYIEDYPLTMEDELPDFLLFSGDVSNYSFLQFWRSLMAFIASFNQTPYSKEFRQYFTRLFYKCVSYIGYSYDDLTMRNFPKLVESLPQKMFMTSEVFWYETERWFFYVEKRFVMYEGLQLIDTTRFHEMYKPGNFIEWLKKFCKTIFRNYIMKQLDSELFEIYVQPGDREKYCYEDTFVVPSAYNIVSKYRPHFLDKISRMLDAEVIENIIKKEEGFREDDITLHGEFTMLCIIALEFYMESTFPEVDMKNYINRNHFYDIRFDDYKFPTICKSFNEYGVFYKGRSVAFCRTSQLFSFWVWMIWHDPEIKGKVPNSKYTFQELYAELFPWDTSASNIYDNGKSGCSSTIYTDADVVLE